MIVVEKSFAIGEISVSLIIQKQTMEGNVHTIDFIPNLTQSKEIKTIMKVNSSAYRNKTP